MAAWTSQRAGDWTRASNNADSPWHDGGAQTTAASYPGGAGTGDTVTIAGHNVTLDANPANSIATITNSGNDGYITVSSTRTLTLTGNPGITYSGTNASGFIRVTANTLTIAYDVGAGSVGVLCSAAGTAIVTSGSGSFALSNSGGTALKGTSTGIVFSSVGTGGMTISGTTLVNLENGRGISCAATGTNTVSGAIVRTGGNNIALWHSGTGTVSFDGSVTVSSTTTQSWAAIYATGSGTLNMSSSTSRALESSGVDILLLQTAGTINWIGEWSIAADKSIYMRTTGGTLNMATAASKLQLACSGTMLLHRPGGTLNTADAGAGAASIVRQNAIANVALELATSAQRGCITGPTLPAEEDVEATVDYGYAGDLQTGTLAAGGGGGAKIIGG